MPEWEQCKWGVNPQTLPSSENPKGEQGNGEGQEGQSRMGETDFTLGGTKLYSDHILYSSCLHFHLLYKERKGYSLLY